MVGRNEKLRGMVLELSAFRGVWAERTTIPLLYDKKCFKCYDSSYLTKANNYYDVHPAAIACFLGGLTLISISISLRILDASENLTLVLVLKRNHLLP